MIFSAESCLQSFESRSGQAEKLHVPAHPSVTAPLSKWKQVFMCHCPSSWPASQLVGSKFPLFLFGKPLGFDAYPCLCQDTLQNIPSNGYKPRERSEGCGLMWAVILGIQGVCSALSQTVCAAWGSCSFCWYFTIGCVTCTIPQQSPIQPDPLWIII